MERAESSHAQVSAVAGWWTRERATFGVVVAATAAVWGHTIDEIRIGELSAIPASVLNLGLLAGWSRLGARGRGWLTLLFGLWWTITVIPYHVIPLLEGLVTWQNVSGLLRVIGGVVMAIAGLRLLRSGAGRGRGTIEPAR